MKVRVLAFASASDALGAAELTVELADGARLDDLRAWLDARHPALAPLWPRLAVAVDGAIAAAGAALHDGAEVALLPPVSGGSGAGSAPPPAAAPATESTATPAPPAASPCALSSSAAPPSAVSSSAASPSAVSSSAAPPSAVSSSAASPSAAPLSAASPAVAQPGAELVEGPIDAQQVMGRVAAPERGAVLLFLGTVRDRTRGSGPPQPVLKLTYSAYRSMALLALQRIVTELQAEIPGVRLAIVHRLGEVAAGEASVAIAAAAPHRAAAYDASRRALERLKAEVPIWKREHFADGLAVWREEEPLKG